MTLDINRLETAIAEQHQNLPFSGVLAVYEKGELVFGEGFGLANRSDEVPNTIFTRFGTASGGKTFTAVAICQLVERGLLTFDTPLRACLDVSFPTFHPGVTIHHLLSHSSGIPDYFDEEEMDDYEVLWKDRPMYAIQNPRDFLPMFQDLPMKFNPGERWHYNNGAYQVLGLVIEQVSGRPYRDFVRENIFEVCGMAESGFFRLDQLPARTALGYIPGDDGSYRTNQYAIPIIGLPDGGVFTTAGDLQKFWQAFRQEGLLVTHATRDKMLHPYYSTDPEDTTDWYGYGFWLKTVEEVVTSPYMLGEDPGVAFLSSWYPARDIQFSMLSNLVSSAWKMARAVNSVIRAE